MFVRVWNREAKKDLVAETIEKGKCAGRAGSETGAPITEESLGYATLCAFERVFPPHPTLSLRERDQQASDWCLADGRWATPGAGVIERRWTILPLPRGEGRGEGEPSGAHLTVQSHVLGRPVRSS